MAEGLCGALLSVKSGVLKGGKSPKISRDRAAVFTCTALRWKSWSHVPVDEQIKVSEAFGIEPKGCRASGRQGPCFFNQTAGRLDGG